MNRPSGYQERVSYRIAGDVRYRVVDDQAVIIVQKAGEAVVLNEMGTRILELIRQQASVKVIVSELSAEFDADKAQIRSDVLAYVADLVDAGVVTELGRDSGPDPAGFPESG